MHKCIIYIGCLVYSCLGIGIYKTVTCRYVLAKEVADDYKITCWNSLRMWASLLSKQLTVVGRGPWYYVCIEYCSNTAYYVCTYVCISAIYPLILAVLVLVFYDCNTYICIGRSGCRWLHNHLLEFLEDVSFSFFQNNLVERGPWYYVCIEHCSNTRYECMHACLYVYLLCIHLY